MTPDDIEALHSPQGEACLTAARELSPTEVRYPACFDRLKKHFPAELARAALDTLLLREKAKGKYARAEEMFFTRELLEMATAEEVSRYRASRYASYSRVIDVGCGLGSDAIGLGLQGCAVTAIDRDPLATRITQANLTVHGITAEVVTADVLQIPWPDAEAAFADPGRRPGGKRVLSVRDAEPSLPDLLARLPRDYPLGVKVAPGIPRAELDEWPADAEFISLRRELKECTLWFGPLRSGHREATILPGPYHLSGEPDPSYCDDSPLGEVLYDPDPAISRAGLMTALAKQVGGSFIDPRIALLSGPDTGPTPFATIYRIVEILPLSAKPIGAWLRQRRIGRVTVLKRGVEIDSDALQKKWKLEGEDHKTLILTKVAGAATAIVAG